MIVARVIAGDAIGRTIGYPTANLECTPDAVGLDDGVYAAHVFLDDAPDGYPAALVVHRARERVEVFLLDFSADLYGKTLKVSPGKKVSDIRTFSSLDDLKKKIDTDVARIRAVFAEQ